MFRVVGVRVQGFTVQGSGFRDSLSSSSGTIKTWEGTMAPGGGGVVQDKATVKLSLDSKSRAFSGLQTLIQL